MTKTRIWLFLQDYGEVLALLVAITATLGSLYYSEVAKFVPCTLCWYQRILMYPLTLILLVGIIKQDEHLPFYVLPFSLLGMGVSTYHVLIENGVISTLRLAQRACRAACAMSTISLHHHSSDGFDSVHIDNSHYDRHPPGIFARIGGRCGPDFGKHHS